MPIIVAGNTPIDTSNIFCVLNAIVKPCNNRSNIVTRYFSVTQYSSRDPGMHDLVLSILNHSRSPDSFNENSAILRADSNPADDQNDVETDRSCSAYVSSYRLLAGYCVAE